MAPKLYKAIVIQFLVLKVSDVICQSALKQYFHVTGIGSHPQTTAIASLPNTAPNVVSNVGIPQQVPNTGLSALSALGLPGLLQALASTAAPNQPALNQVITPTYTSQPSTAIAPISKAPIQQISNQPTSNQPTLNQETTGIDASVLNNLAIALQLMIVNNILNSNLPENESSPVYDMLENVKNAAGAGISKTPTQPAKEHPIPGMTEDIFKDLTFQPYKDPIYDPLHQESYSLHNSNFLGTTGFNELTSVSDPYTKNMTPRNNYQLMSPYEALGPNSPFSDPILSSPYGSIISSKKDFQSPYLLMDSDPFTKNDFSF